ARSTAFQVRFIEFMPLDADQAWTPDSVLTGEELRQIIHAVYPIEELPREPSATARVFRFADGKGEIGFINPVSEPFCADCNRVRITAEGKLRTCLFSLHETDLREHLRSGASDAELERIIRDPVWTCAAAAHWRATPAACAGGSSSSGAASPRSTRCGASSAVSRGPCGGARPPRRTARLWPLPRPRGSPRLSTQRRCCGGAR